MYEKAERALGAALVPCWLTARMIEHFMGPRSKRANQHFFFKLSFEHF